MKAKYKLKLVKIILLMLVLSFLFNRGITHAQSDSTYSLEDSADNPNFEEIFMPWNFYSFNSPDSTFIALEDGSGYTNPEWNATIKFVMAFPGGFANAKKDFEKIKATSESILLDTINNYLNGRKAFTVITEEIAPKGSGFENFIFIQTIVELEKYTIGMGGGYPKSKDKEWRQKFINAALSVKKK